MASTNTESASPHVSMPDWN